MENTNNERLGLLKINFRDKNHAQMGYEAFFGGQESHEHNLLKKVIYNINGGASEEEKVWVTQNLESFIAYFNTVMLSVLIDEDSTLRLDENFIDTMKKLSDNRDFVFYTSKYRHDKLVDFLKEYCASELWNFHFNGNRIDQFTVDQILMQYRFRLNDEDFFLILNLLKDGYITEASGQRHYWSDIEKLLKAEDSHWKFDFEEAPIFEKAFNGFGKLVEYIDSYLSLLELIGDQRNREIIWLLENNLFVEIKNQIGEKMINALQNVKKSIAENRFLSAYYYDHDNVSFEKWRYESINNIIKSIDNIRAIQEKENTSKSSVLSGLFDEKQEVVNNNKFLRLQTLVASVEADVEKFYQTGNSAAGTRVRRGMQDLRILAQEIKQEITSNQKAGHDADNS